nr:unnamed protein product [Callosobruchus analis]
MIITSKILAKGRFENGNMGNDVLLGDRGYGLVIFVNVINNPKIKRKIKEYSRTSSSYLEKKIPNSVCRIRTRVPLAQMIIFASAVLHNIAMQHHEADFEDE